MLWHTKQKQKKMLHHGQDAIIQGKVSGFQCLDQSSTAPLQRLPGRGPPQRPPATTGRHHGAQPFPTKKIMLIQTIGPRNCCMFLLFGLNFLGWVRWDFRAPDLFGWIHVTQDSRNYILCLPSLEIFRTKWSDFKRSQIPKVSTCLGDQFVNSSKENLGGARRPKKNKKQWLLQFLVLGRPPKSEW